MTIALYQAEQIRQIEAQVIAEKQASEMELMQQAGRSAWHHLQENWPDARRIVVCCGKGKNGGDGFVLAKLAKQAGLEVQIYAMASSDDLRGLVRQVAQQAESCGVTITLMPSHPLFEADVIVDALFGTGIKGHVSEPYARAIMAMNDAEAPVLALDVPSGLDCDTGHILGQAVEACKTVTFIGLKQGMFTDKGPAYCGEVRCESLNIPEMFFAKQKSSAALLTWDDAKQSLPTRARDAHKGDFGHVLIIGGDYGMGGAVRMAAEAAMRVGAGLVTVATRPEHVTVVNASRPEIMCQQVVRADDLEPMLKRASVVVIGPGLGKSDWALQLLSKVLSQSLPLVIDADGLSLLSQMELQSEQWILTPHPGEASRLLHTTTTAVQHDRFSAIDAVTRQYGGVVVLKGVGTLIQQQHGSKAVCPAGNPGMATGGMGDVLSGVIGGLVAQHFSLLKASQVGVLIHAMAADLAAKEGGERGLMATDLMRFLRELVNPE